MRNLVADKLWNYTMHDDEDIRGWHTKSAVETALGVRSWAVEMYEMQRISHRISMMFFQNTLDSMLEGMKKWPRRK